VACSTAVAALSVATWWTRAVPARSPVPAGGEPSVAVVVPACGEPVPMVLRTVRSVLDQDWPAAALLVLVPDDGHDPALRAALAGWPVRYVDPPRRDAPGRDGAAKG
jgi:hypothetical protein